MLVTYVFIFKCIIKKMNGNHRKLRRKSRVDNSHDLLLGPNNV